MHYAQLAELANNLFIAQSMGQISATLDHEWKNSNTIIKRLTDDDKYALMMECSILNLPLEEGEDQVSFLIPFPGLLNVIIA